MLQDPCMWQAAYGAMLHKQQQIPSHCCCSELNNPSGQSRGALEQRPWHNGTRLAKRLCPSPTQLRDLCHTSMSSVTELASQQGCRRQALTLLADSSAHLGGQQP